MILNTKRTMFIKVCISHLFTLGYLVLLLCPNDQDSPECKLKNLKVNFSGFLANRELQITIRENIFLKKIPSLKKGYDNHRKVSRWLAKLFIFIFSKNLSPF